jgi:hypothetical protein
MKWRIKLAKKMAMTLYVSDVYSKLLSFLITFHHSSYLKKLEIVIDFITNCFIIQN